MCKCERHRGGVQNNRGNLFLLDRYPAPLLLLINADNQEEAATNNQILRVVGPLCCDGPLRCLFDNRAACVTLIMIVNRFVIV